MCSPHVITEEDRVMRQLLERYPSIEIMDRINAALRPMDTIPDRRAIFVKLLEIIEGLSTIEERVIAFTYAALDAHPFVYFSGPETPLTAYPDSTDPRMQPVGEERREQIVACVREIIASLGSSETTLAQCGEHIWTYIASRTSVLERVLALAVAVRGSGVNQSCMFEIPVSDMVQETYNAALWNNRDVIRGCRWCLTRSGIPGEAQTKDVGGRIILDLLATIEDPVDRACVLAFLFEETEQRARNAVVQGLIHPRARGPGRPPGGAVA